MSREIAWVGSADEQLAYLIARYGPQGSWQVLDQRIATLEDGMSVERVRLGTGGGEVEVEFRDALPDVISFTEPVEDRSHIGTLEDLMQRAAEFAAANPPHHPGTLPRFPVPVEHYGEAVAVPLPILAVDDFGRRGLFAPPRMVVIGWRDHEPVGLREFPDFDPEHWPPRRLGEWPAARAAALPPEQLQATIQRFGACWSRVLDRWFDDRETRDAVLSADVTEALRLRGVLDPSAMEPVYAGMNPRFATWLEAVRRGDR